MTKKYNNGGLRGTNIPTGGYQSSRTGIWSLTELRPPPAGPGDPNFANVLFLGYFDQGVADTQNWGLNYGYGGGRIFRQIFVSGGSDPFLSSVSSKWGITSLAGGNLTSTYSSGYAWGTADFTIEWWAYNPVPASSVVAVYEGRPAGTNGATPTVYWDASNIYHYFVNGGDIIVGSTSTNTGTWHFGSISRVSGTTYMHLNGALEGSVADSTSYAPSVTVTGPFIGNAAFSGATANTSQLIDSMRVTVGVGRYNGSNYTVPGARFPAHG